MYWRETGTVLHEERIGHHSVQDFVRGWIKDTIMSLVSRAFGSYKYCHVYILENLNSKGFRCVFCRKQTVRWEPGNVGCDNGPSLAVVFGLVTSSQTISVRWKVEGYSHCFAVYGTNIRFKKYARLSEWSHELDRSIRFSGNSHIIPNLYVSLPFSCRKRNETSLKALGEMVSYKFTLSF